MRTLLSNVKEGLGITTVNEIGALNTYKAWSATVANAVNTGQTSVESAERLGFEKIKLTDLLTGKMGTGTFDQSLYNKNWLIDIDVPGFDGRLFSSQGAKNKSGQYIAISANPTPEDISAYRPELMNQPQEVVKGLVGKIEDYRNNFFGWDTTKRAEKLQDIFDQLQKAKDAQFNLLNSKTGAMAELTTAHMYDAMRATARGMHYLGHEGSDKFTGGAVQIDNGLQGLADVVEQVNLANPSKVKDISMLSFNGINLSEEAKKGAHALQLNYSIMSIGRMNNIYDEQFSKLRDAINPYHTKELDEFLESIKQSTKEIVQTEGVEGISSREPQQYPGSVTQRRIYFNSIANDNEVLGDFITAQMRKEDYDADKVVNTLHREQISLKLGDTDAIKVHADSAMIEALMRYRDSHSDANIQIKFLDQGGEQRMKNYVASQYYLGAGELQRYRIVNDLMAGDAPEIDSFNFENMPTYENSEVMKNYLLAKTKWSLGDRAAAQKSYEDMLHSVFKDMMSRAALDPERFGPDFLSAGYKEQIVRLHDFINEESKKGDTSVITDDDRENFKELRQRALQFEVANQKREEDLIKRSGFAPTGTMNMAVQTTYDMANTVLDNAHVRTYLENKGKDAGIIMEQLNLVNLAMTEGFMTPKNVDMSNPEAKKLQAQMVRQTQQAYHDLFALRDNDSAYERERVKRNLQELMKSVVIPRQYGIEMSRNPELPTLRDFLKIASPSGTVALGNNYKVNIDQMSEEVLTGYTKGAISNVVSFLVDDIFRNDSNINAYKIAASNPNGNPNNAIITIPKNSTTFGHRIMIDVFEKSAEQLDTPGIVTVSNPLGPNLSTKVNLDETKALEKNFETRSKQANTLETPPKPPKKLITEAKALQMSKKMGILGAAIGVAGGLTLGGMISNPVYTPRQRRDNGEQRPLPVAGAYAFGNTPIPNSSLPEPSTGLAAGAAADYATQYPQQISLADPNLQIMSAMPRGSYTVNIKGNSPRGQQAAVNALTNVHNVLPQNSSINIAMNSNYSDMMSQAQVNRMIQTAMGV